MVARGVGRELAASVAAHRDILYRIQHPCGMIIPCFSPVVNTFFCGFGGSRNFRDIVTKTTGYSGVVWLKGRPGCPAARGEPRARRGAGGACPRAALAIPAPGERTISNAEVPLPRSPLSLAAGIVQRKAFPPFLHRAAGSLSQGACMAGAVSAASSLMQGCRGRSPRRNKL